MILIQPKHTNKTSFNASSVIGTHLRALISAMGQEGKDVRWITLQIIMGMMAVNSELLFGLGLLEIIQLVTDISVLQRIICAFCFVWLTPKKSTQHHHRVYVRWTWKLVTDDGHLITFNIHYSVTNENDIQLHYPKSRSILACIERANKRCYQPIVVGVTGSRHC